MLTAPLPIEKLNEVISKQNEVHQFNYRESKIKGRPFIFYLSNLNVKASINFDGLTTEELSELLKTYMEVNVLFKCEELNVLAMLSILKFMKVECDDISTIKVPDDFFDTFIENNGNLLSRYFVFLSSMVSFCDFIADKAEEKPHDVSGYKGVIDDGKFIGVNVVWLFEIPCFFELFFSSEVVTEYPQYLFPVQFDDFVFNGKKLITFFVKEGDVSNNWLLLNKFLIEAKNERSTDSTGEHSGGEEGRE